MRPKRFLNTHCDYIYHTGMVSYNDEYLEGNRGLIYGIFMEHDIETNLHYVDYWNVRYVTDHVNLPKPFYRKS